MDFFLMILLMYLMLFKWTIYCQDESSHLSSVSIETQYLKFDMSQYGPDGGAFSSRSNHTFRLLLLSFFLSFVQVLIFRIIIRKIQFYSINLSLHQTIVFKSRLISFKFVALHHNVLMIISMFS